MKLSLLKERLNSQLRDWGICPFFALNDELDPKRIKQALKELAKKGASGVILHPRTGLEVEYLSEEFFHRIKIAIETCCELGIKAWLYDEYNWPSGQVAGRLLAKYPELRQKYLNWIYLKKPTAGKRIKPQGKVVAVFSTSSQPELLEDCFNEEMVIVPKINNDLLIIFEQQNYNSNFASYCAPWVKPSHGYIDLSNPETAQRIIQMVYANYAKRFEEWFGKTVLGIFIDEPMNYNGIPWSDELVRCFQEKYGYDPLGSLYLLILNRENSIKFRTEYYRLYAELVSRNFFEVLSDFCTKHRLKLTGHLCMEEKLSELAVNHGSIYLHLRCFHMPGIDALGAGDGIFDGLAGMEAPNFAVKMASSIAHIEGKKRVLCEAGGGAGWGMELGEFKRMTNWLFALGVNFITPHQVLLSTKGIRKRDFPPSHFWQEPWWIFYPEFSRYASKMSFLLSQGRHLAELAILFPTSTFQALCAGRRKSDELKTLSRNIEELIKNLLSYHYDFDFLFEEAVEENKAKISQGEILAGEGKYKVLIVPWAEVLSKSALDFILEFAQSGGWLFFLGKLPERNCNGDYTREFREKLLSCSERIRIIDEDAWLLKLIETLTRVFPAKLGFENYPKGILSHKRELDDAELIVLFNLSAGFHFLKGLVRTEMRSLELYLPWKNEFKPIIQHRIKEGIKFELGLEENECAVIIASNQPAPDWIQSTNLIPLHYDEKEFEGFYIGEGKVKARGKEYHLGKGEIIELEIKKELKFKPLAPNLYRLGPWKVRAEKTAPLSFSELWQDKALPLRSKALISFLKLITPALDLYFMPGRKFREIIYTDFEELNLLERAKDFLKLATGIDFWQKGLYESIDLLMHILSYLPQKELNFPAPGSWYQAEAKFKIEDLPEKLELVWEDLGEPVEITINGMKRDLRPARKRIWDDANLVADITPYLRQGKNQLIFRSKMPSYPCLYPCLHTIEPVVLRGEFEVKKGILKKSEEKKSLGDLKEMGYPHFMGAVAYFAKIILKKEQLERWLILECGKVLGALEVWVNGKRAGVRLSAPYRFHISELVKEGENQLQFVLTNTSANLLSLPESFGVFGPIKIHGYPKKRIKKAELERMLRQT